MSEPPWFGLSKNFYRRLAQIARECGVTRQEVLKKGIEHFRDNFLHAKSDSLSEGQARELLAVTHRKFAQNWWSKISAEERTKRAKRAAAGRWGKP